MNGVEILNETPVYGTAEWSLYTMMVLLIGAPIILTVYAIVKVVQGEHWSFIIINLLFGLLLGIFFASLFVVSADKTEIAHDKNNIKSYKYQVIISDEVKFNEFTEKYEIIEQNGNIYTIQERN